VHSLAVICIGLRQDSSNGDFGSRLWTGGVSVRVTVRPRGPVTVDLFPLDLNGCESYLLYQIVK
jgi:hypothetical protein